MKVPLRGCGREKAHKESWVAERALSALIAANVLDPSTRIELRDESNKSPDRLFCAPDKTIGVEITEAVSQAYADADEYRNKNSPDSLIDLSEFQDGGRGESADPAEMLRHPDSKDRSPGWHGHSVERQLRSLAEARLADKRRKLGHYDRYDEDWLVIYASAPGPCLDRQGTVRLIGLPETRSSDDEFHRVFLLVGDMLVCLRTGKEYPVAGSP